MCGLVAYNGSESGFDDVYRANAKLVHRGPDDRGTYTDRDGRVCLAHRRLSIIDPEEGCQPLTRGESTVVYNGEIYNYLELRTELKREGYKFQTDSDTEVLLQSYRAWGKACLEKLRGMFAFVIWDRTRERLFLARDRLGQKPLFYARVDGQFAAASEIQALLEFPWISRRINEEILGRYVFLNYVPSPESGFQDIKKLRPGHFLTVQNGEVIEDEPYWDLDYQDEDIPFEDACDRLRFLLTEATELRMRSDVPVGAFLSGGIDSSVTVSLMSRLSDAPVETFTIGFDTPDLDESNYARQVADRYHTNHHVFQVRPDFVDILPDLIHHYGEPLADPSIIPTYYVARETSKHLKVCLSGDGGDELFGGYERYLRMRQRLGTNGLPKTNTDFVSSRLASELFTELVRDGPLGWMDAGKLDDFYRLIQPFTGDSARLYVSDYVSPHSRTSALRLFKEVPADSAEQYLRGLFDAMDDLEDPAQRCMAVDTFSYLPENLLTKVDVATMRHSLECRSPFLDHKLVEFVASLPSNYKIRGTRKKHILKETFKNRLPGPVIRRSKQGFLFPFPSWFRGTLEEYIRERLLSRHDEFHRIIDRRTLETVIEQHCSVRRNHGWLLWNMLVFRIWVEEMNVQL